MNPNPAAMATFESFKRRRTQPPPPILVEMPDYMEEQDMDMSPDVRQIDRSNITVVPLDDRACVGAPEEMNVRQMGTEPCSGENDEEKQQKKRNREEIMCFYKAYRRLKACLAKNPRLGTSELAEELEDAYFGMLKLSNGCVSIRRIVAELIPRYAVFCPSALQAASRVVLQLCEWSSSIVVQGENCDEFLTQTAETCLYGLVELSVAATTIASSISSLNNTCKVVCQDVAIYLLCQLGDQELVPHKSFEEQSSDICLINKLRTLVASNLLKLFCCDPENVVGACFHLLHSDNRDQHKSGLHFINQILLHEDSSKTIPTNEGHKYAILEPASGSKNSQEKDQLEKESSQSDEKPSQESPNLITKVIHPKPALERWIVSAVHKYRRSAAHEAVAEALPTLFKLLRSLRTFVLSDLELSVEEAMEEDKPSMPTRTRHPGNLGTPERRSRGRGSITDPDVWYRDKEHWPPSSQRETNMSSFGKGEGISSSRETSRRAFKTLKDSDRYFVSDNADMRVKDREGWNASFNKMEDRSWSNVWRGGKVADRNFERPVGNEGDAWSRTRDYPSNFRKESNVYVPSPQQSTTPKSRLSSPNQGPIGWYRDGDPAAMDVFAASERLWIGSLSSAVTENNLRSQFAKFGPVDGISVFSEQGFALMEYRDIRDAVKARESMQFSPVWGKPLQIKFLDASLGSRGVFGGAALGGSSHVWVGSVPSQSAKDEILKDLIATGLKGPRTVFASLSSNSILMEFDAPEEAAAVMLHIRQRRREARCAFMPRGCASGDGGGSIGSRHLWVGRVDPILQEDELLSAFSQFGELTGWKFIRQSGCCFIDFRAPESAELAKAQLNGMRFGNQCIIVEHKNNPQKNASGPILNSPPGNATFHSPSSITSGGRAAGEGSLSLALANLCSKFLITSTGNAASLCGKPRSARSGFAREGTERVPTNTLWIGLPDIVGPSFMNEGELRTLFTLAATGIGTVTKVRSARTSRGPCRFVEFDGVETAATALHNIAGHLDPSIQIEFSNSAISLQQAEQPHIHGHMGNSHLQQFDEVPYRPWREKHRAVGRTWEWEQEPESPTPLEYSEVRGRTRHHVNPHGWSAFPEKNLAGESYYGDHGHVIYESPRDLKDEKRNDNSFKRTNDATMLSPNAGGHADSVNSTIGSPVVSQSTLIGSKHSFDAAASAPLSVRGLPHGASLAPLPVAKIQVDRVPSANSWAGPVLPPSPLDQISPAGSTSLHKALMTSPMANAVYASGKLDAVTSYAPIVMPSPVTPLTDLSTNIPHPVEYGMPIPPLPPASPLPPLPSETPPPPPLSPPPLPPPPSSPPPPLPSPPSQVSLTESRGKRETQNWQGPLCKSGMQYCVVVAESISTGSSQYTINMHEPVGWPEKLDVTKRADFKSVKQTFNLSSSYQREVCRLFASPSSGTANYNGFIQFIDYLKQRDRAGVVKLPSARALWSRMLYILPWSSEACELLGVGPQREDSLICLIMPSGSSASSVT